MRAQRPGGPPALSQHTVWALLCGAPTNACEAACRTLVRKRTAQPTTADSQSRRVRTRARSCIRHSTRSRTHVDVDGCGPCDLCAVAELASGVVAPALQLAGDDCAAVIRARRDSGCAARDGFRRRVGRTAIHV